MKCVRINIIMHDLPCIRIYVKKILVKHVLFFHHDHDNIVDFA